MNIRNLDLSHIANGFLDFFDHQLVGALAAARLT